MPNPNPPEICFFCGKLGTSKEHLIHGEVTTCVDCQSKIGPHNLAKLEEIMRAKTEDDSE